MKLGDWAHFLPVKRAYSLVTSSCWLTLQNESGGHASNSCYAIELQVKVCVCTQYQCTYKHAHTSLHVHAYQCYKNCVKNCALHPLIKIIVL